MKRSTVLLTASWGLSFSLLACTDPAKPDTARHPPDPVQPVELEDCAASAEWVPITPPLAADQSGNNSFERPAPHPATECPFYRSAYQTFLLAGQPDTRTQFQGEPAIKSFATLDDLFDRYTSVKANLAPAGEPRGTKGRAWLGDIKQAGGRQIMIDQNGHTLYYGLHVNQAFVDFVHDNHLTNAYLIQNADPNIFFTAGVAEYKTAWQEVDSQDPTAGTPDGNSADLKDYIWTTAWVPTLSQDANGIVEEDRDHPRLVTVRLLAIHSVIALPGHPEFIWGSFEHSTADIFNGDSDVKAANGFRDVAPIVPPGPDGEPFNPSADDPNNLNNTSVVTDMPATHSDGYIAYAMGTTVNKANSPFQETDLVLDPQSQKFFLKSNPMKVASTSIYRMFPASKSHTVDPDDAVTSLNSNVEWVFKNNQDKLDPNDRRSHYRLIGAQWMDKPKFFDIDQPLQNDETSPLIKSPMGYPDVNQATDRASVARASLQDLIEQKAVPAGFQCQPQWSAQECNIFGRLAVDGTDGEFSILGGEDRMSSTVMESFSQAPDNFFNCFRCHNTQAIAAKGVPFAGGAGVVQLIGPKLFNVSHITSQFILEECGNNLVDNPDGSKTAKCPNPSP